MEQFEQYLRRQGYRGDMERPEAALRRIKNGAALGDLALLAKRLRIAEYVSKTGDGPEGLKDLMAF